MTTSELDIEWNHIYQTRLGALCGANEPTTAQIDMAFAEASEHIANLKLTFTKSVNQCLLF